MTAVWLRCRAELRSRWRAWLALALLVALAGGLVIAAAAAARRTASAYPRFLAAHSPADVVILSGDESLVYQQAFAPIAFEEVSRLPHVESAARLASYYFLARTGSNRLLSGDDFLLAASPDGLYGTEINRFEIVAGRPADPDRVDEVIVGFSHAEQFGLKVGSTLLVRFLEPRATSVLHGASSGSGNAPETADSWDGPLLTFRVVGIEASPGEFPPETGAPRTGESSAGSVPAVFLTPAFHRAYEDKVAATELFAVKLGRGEADLAPFTAALDELGQGRPVLYGTQRDQAANVQRSIQPLATLLWVVAGFFGAAMLLAVGQALVRQVFLEATEHPTLRALGMAPGQLFALGLARATVIGALGAALAVGLAFLFSPLAPVGVARTAEPDPGFALDGLVIGVGAGAVLLLVVLISALSSWRALRVPTTALGPGRPGVRRRTAAVAEACAGLAPSAVVGIRMALEPGHGRTAAPVRTTMTASVLAIASMAAALTFAGSLSHLLDTPRLYGWTWDVQLGTGVFPGGRDRAFIEGSPWVAGLAVGTTARVAVDGLPIDALAMDVVKGTLRPAAIEGRSPAAPDELLLGTRTLNALRARIGETVEVRIGESSVPMTVVGRGVFPDFAQTVRLGQGAWINWEGLTRLAPDTPEPGIFLVRFRNDSDRREFFSGAFGPFSTSAGTSILDFQALEPRTPAELTGIRKLPLILAGVVAGLAVAVLAQTLVTVVRRRRRDLAILKTLGFVRRQVLAAVAWQASTVAVVGLAVGLPLGVAAGRWAWTLYAEHLGVVPVPVIPMGLLLLAVPATILAAMVISALPGLIAARTRPALVLRAE